MKPISCNQEMGNTERLLRPGAPQVLLGIKTSDANCKTDCVSLPVVLREESFDLNAKITVENVMNMFECL